MLKSIALAVLIIPAVIYTTHKEWQHLGFWNFSDEESKQYIAELGERMGQLPDVMGDWKYVSETPINPEQIRAAKITKYQARLYRNSVTGAEVSIFLSTGPRGDICVHTPAQCHPNAGHVAVAEEQVRDVYDADEAGEQKDILGSFVWQRYRTNQNQETEIWWSFNEVGKWEGTKNPRMNFTKPGLFKLYVTAEKMGAGKSSDPPQVSFLRAFLPKLDNNLFPPEKPAEDKVAVK